MTPILLHRNIRLIGSSFLLLFICINIYCQDWRYELFTPKFEEEILSKSNLENERMSRVFRDLSFIGSYNEIYKRDAYIDSTLEQAVISILDGHSIEEAKSHILARSQDEQILIINESHHRPEHRNFTRSLLDDLYKQGYRYLALEAILSNQHRQYTNYPVNKYNLGDTTIFDRGYPLMKACSGTYVKEPVFGNLIRRALELGFTLIGYEQTGKTRELNQALNIARIFKSDPKAKVVIHCGYGHLIESPRQRGNQDPDTLMAGYLKKLTGVDPFTIDQTSYYNYINLSKYVSTRTKSIHPQCFIQDGKTFKSHKPEEQEFWDLTIFHPITSYQGDRPRWLTDNISAKAFIVESSEIVIDFPIRLKLFNKSDRLDAVPIDVIEARTPIAKLILYGSIEEAKVVVENANGDRQIIQL